MPNFSDPIFWVAISQVILIDILLSGDNAVVIALACRNLPENQRKAGIFWGVGGAIFLRVVLTFFAVTLLTLSYVKLIGAVLLLWIGIKLTDHGGQSEGKDVNAADSLYLAIKTIVIADFVMSLDNVVAVAAAARDSVFVLVFGLLLSIPLMIWSSRIILRLIDRWPVIVVLGGALLGWIAIKMAITDPAIQHIIILDSLWVSWILPLFGALLVVIVGCNPLRKKTEET